MKKFLKYAAVALLGVVACEPEFDNPIEESQNFMSGDADFSTYVALGNSLTAGYADGGLYILGQENSYPNLMAKKFADVGGGEFRTPFVNDNNGGLLLPDGSQLDFRLVLATDEAGNRAPRPYNVPATTNVTNIITGPFNNMGVAGAKSFHLGIPGYGNLAGLATGEANPYFIRFASSPNASILEDAVAQNPTFFSLWIGSNDILTYATSGGIGVDQTGNLNPASYASIDITDPTVFAGAYAQTLAALTANNSKGVLLTLPDVMSIPFFTTVPNNALVLDTQQAANLTGFFQAFAGIATVVLASPPFSLPIENAQAIASQYALTFNEGPNRFLIKEESPTNPFGFRQMTEEELLLLTIDTDRLAQGYGSVVLTPDVLQVLGLLQMGGTPTPEQSALVINAVSGIEDKDVLDTNEIGAISTALTSYNATIKALAEANDLALYDAHAQLEEIAEGGIAINGGLVTSVFGSGGGFSLDGIHPTQRTHAIIANGVMKAIEEKYGANLSEYDPATFGTITLSNEVN